MTASNELPPYPTADELARARWFKATASSGGQGCVEVAHLDHWTVVRDSKEPRWASALLHTARVGVFPRRHPQRRV